MVLRHALRDTHCASYYHVIGHRTEIVAAMLTHEQVLTKLVLAALLGSIVGLERERLDWAAGLRTHMLVCLGATL